MSADSDEALEVLREVWRGSGQRRLSSPTPPEAESRASGWLTSVSTTLRPGKQTSGRRGGPGWQREGKLARSDGSVRDLVLGSPEPPELANRRRGESLRGVPQTVGELTEQLRQGGYLADRGLATSLLVSLSLHRPVLLEGEVGVGKTEMAKVLAACLRPARIRLQCYEGIDTNQALYEWDYARQMLQIRALSERQAAGDDAVDKLFGPKFLLERPLLAAIRAGDQAVLLIDEIDRADDEFEAFLLELLSDFQISDPRDRHRLRAPPRRRW